jgi:hypothetical protein
LGFCDVNLHKNNNNFIFSNKMTHLRPVDGYASSAVLRVRGHLVEGEPGAGAEHPRVCGILARVFDANRLEPCVPGSCWTSAELGDREVLKVLWKFKKINLNAEILYLIIHRGAAALNLVAAQHQLGFGEVIGIT